MLAPGLSRDAQLVPSSAGLLASVAGEVELMAIDLAPAQQAQLLDLLEKGNEFAEICAATGVTAQQLRTLVDRLTALELMAAEVPGVPPVDPLRYFHEVDSVTVPDEPPRHVLLVGLGQLGLAFLRELLRFEHFRPRLFDPTRVEPCDLLPFYRVDELGRAKAEVVTGWLGGAQRARVDAVIPRCFATAGVERDLEVALDAVEVAICCLDKPSTLSTRLTQACHARRLPLVVAQLTARGGLIDPVLVPDIPHARQGCANCAALYRAGADPFTAALLPYLAARFPQSAPWRYRHEKGQIEAFAGLTVLALRKAFDIRIGCRPPDSKVTRVDFAQGQVDTVPVPPHYACSLCFPASRATYLPLRAGLQSATARLALDTLAKRLQPLAGRPYGIFEPGMGMSPRERQGIFRAFRQRGVEPLHNRLANAHRVASVRRTVRGAEMVTQVGEYLDLEDSRNAEAIAMIEGLERLFTLDYCSPERIVNGVYADLEAVALDPRRLPLFADEQYAEADFPLQRFDPRAPISWIEGVTLTTDRSCLVPLDFVRSNPARAIYHATSNGAACHSSLPQAIVNAIYETIERDAFMITWLNQLTLPGIEFNAADPDPYDLRDTLHRLGLDLAVVDLTLDLEIPVLLGVLRDRHHPDFLLTNMVASLDPKRALTKLSRELAQFAYRYLRDPRCFESGLTQATDPNEVWTFQDHLAFYQAREKHQHAEFLTQAPRRRALRDYASRPDVTDIRSELEILKEWLARRGYDIIVVDCTVPMLAELGLHAVKVVIPGLQPLNAGHQRRVLGGRRLYQMPVDLGLSAREKTLAELNPWPHPFW